MSKVKRVYVEKKQPYAVTAKELKEDIKGYLEIDGLKEVRVLVRYDVENLSEDTYKKALTSVFSEPPVDDVYEETFPFDEANSKVFSVEFLPGQFDQRADSAVQCVKFLNEDENPVIKTATTYVLVGDISDAEFEQIKNYCINPVDSRETGLEKPETLVTEFEEPADVIIFDGFKDMEEKPLKELYDSLGLAMTFKDFLHIQNYFKNEETSETELYFEGPFSSSTWYGDELTPALFKNVLNKHPGNLTVWISSPGGDVFAASLIYTMLKNHKGRITVKIDSLAASAASVVAMAGDTTWISPTGMLMIHNPATIAMGNKTEMEKAITLLDEGKESIINAYEEKTHLSRSKIAKMMDEETWINAKKAKQLGFVDGILFSKKETEEKEPDKDEPEEEPDEKQKPKKAPESMLYSTSATNASLLQKISAATPTGVPINQLEKRLALLKY